MKDLKLTKLILSLVLVSAFLIGCNVKETTKGFEVKSMTDQAGYNYETVTNDPMGVRIYTLKNGLKVYLSVNKDEPRIQTFIAVRAGSKSDPAETTGLAHYLEHMMFKGTDEIGSVNWEKEKVLLEKISNLYEKHKAEQNEKKKKEIYKEIDKLSNEASKYCVANDYDKILTSLGAKGTNAHTSYERTVYMNDIPKNELKKWVKVEKERFSQLVLRLFHTELEAVYEEFNISQDNDFRKVYEKVLAGLFKKHPYGTQSVIGKGEHLKNPSMVNIHNYWNKYYVPNNLAICMSGDLDFENTIKLLDSEFGHLKRGKDVEKLKFEKEEPITSPIVSEVFGPESESLNFAYRFNNVNSMDFRYVRLIDMLLNNSKAGLIDLDLVQKQKVLSAGCSPTFMEDYGMHMFSGKPRKGQTLEEVKDLILGEIEKIKKGEFDDWMLEAVVNNLRLNEIKSQERNFRAYQCVDSFIKGMPWIDKVKFNDDLEKITKAEVVDFAKKHYGNNYVLVYKRKGEAKDLMKVEKPKITKINLNRSLESEFSKKIREEKTSKIQPVFIDFNKDINKVNLKSGVVLRGITNKTNDLFQLDYIIDMGKYNDKLLAMAVQYLKFMGTSKYTPEQFQKELYKYGLSLGVSVSPERSYVYMSGLNKSFDKGIELLEHVLKEAKGDPKTLSDFVKGILKKREDGKLNKGQILYGGMFSYAEYGENNPFKYIIPKEELEKLVPEQLELKIKEITSYKHHIYYYGPKKLEEVKTILDEKHFTPSTLKEIPKGIEFAQQDVNSNTVYFVNYDGMVQANILMLTKDVKYDSNITPYQRMYGNYYGSGLSSIFFQEIREAKGLAYGVGSVFMSPNKKDKNFNSIVFIGTQPDKVKEALNTSLNLLNKMAKAEKQFNSSKESVLKKIETERITKGDVFWTWLSNKDMGIEGDIRKKVYYETKTMDLVKLEDFFNKHIKDKKYNFMILGDRKRIDFKMLKKFGKVKELTLKEVFNF